MKGEIVLDKNDRETEVGFPVKIVLSHNRKIRRKTIQNARGFDRDEFFNLPKSIHPDFDSAFAMLENIGMEKIIPISMNLLDLGWLICGNLAVMVMPKHMKLSAWNKKNISLS